MDAITAIMSQPRDTATDRNVTPKKQLSQQDAAIKESVKKEVFHGDPDEYAAGGVFSVKARFQGFKTPALGSSEVTEQPRFWGLRWVLPISPLFEEAQVKRVPERGVHSTGGKARKRRKKMIYLLWPPGYAVMDRKKKECRMTA